MPTAHWSNRWPNPAISSSKRSMRTRPGFDGFANGARSVDPEFEVVAKYVGNWHDVALAREHAEALIEQGARFLFQNADKAGLGVFQAAAAHEGVFAFGSNKDQNDVSPEAIRSYFDYAYDEWTRQPQFVLLVGDASEDTRNLLDTSQPNFIPTIMYRIDDEHNMPASDQWYTSTEGPPYLPQMFIGRLSVGGTAQLGTVVSKILAYEEHPATAPWRKNILFVADGVREPAGALDRAVELAGLNEARLTVMDVVEPVATTDYTFDGEDVLVFEEHVEGAGDLLVPDGLRRRGRGRGA